MSESIQQSQTEKSLNLNSNLNINLENKKLKMFCDKATQTEVPDSTYSSSNESSNGVGSVLPEPISSTLQLICSATTAAGKPCKFKIKNNNKYCGKHLKKFKTMDEIKNTIETNKQEEEKIQEQIDISEMEEIIKYNINDVKGELKPLSKKKRNLPEIADGLRCNWIKKDGSRCSFKRIIRYHHSHECCGFHKRSFDKKIEEIELGPHNIKLNLKVKKEKEKEKEKVKPLYITTSGVAITSPITKFVLEEQDLDSDREFNQTPKTPNPSENNLSSIYNPVSPHFNGSPNPDNFTPKKEKSESPFNPFKIEPPKEENLKSPKYCSMFDLEDNLVPNHFEIYSKEAQPTPLEEDPTQNNIQNQNQNNNNGNYKKYYKYKQQRKEQNYKPLSKQKQKLFRMKAMAEAKQLRKFDPDHKNKDTIGGSLLRLRGGSGTARTHTANSRSVQNYAGGAIPPGRSNRRNPTRPEPGATGAEFFQYYLDMGWITIQRTEVIGITEYFFHIVRPEWRFDPENVLQPNLPTNLYRLLLHASLWATQHNQSRDLGAMGVQRHLRAQFLFVDDAGNWRFSTGFAFPNTPGEIFHRFIGLMSHRGSDTTEGELDVIRILIPSGMVGNDGGCDSDYHIKNCGNYKIKTIKSKNNNCGIGCLLSVYNKKKNKNKTVKKKRADQIRKELNIELGIKLNFKHLKSVAKYLKVGFRLWEIEANTLKPTKYFNIKKRNIVDILFNKATEHYNILILKTVKQKCNLCGKERKNMEKHKCNGGNIEFYKKQVTGNIKDYAIFKDKTVEDLPDLNKVYVFDLETFPNLNNIQLVYACKIQNVGTKEEWLKYKSVKNKQVEVLEDILKISMQGEPYEYEDQNPGEETGEFKLFTGKGKKSKIIKYEKIKQKSEIYLEAKEQFNNLERLDSNGNNNNDFILIDNDEYSQYEIKNGHVILYYFKYDINQDKSKIHVENKLKKLIHYNPCIFVAHNLARFDGMFLMSYLLSKKIDVNITINGGRIISLSWYNSKVWDTCLFIPKTLKAIAKQFKCVVQKEDFDHELIKSWDNVDTYKDTASGIVYDKETDKFKMKMGWKPYLDADIYSLREIVEKYSTEVFNEFKINVFDFVTLSSMSYNLWGITTMDLNVEIQTPQEKDYNFIKDSIYGGRVFPMIKYFNSGENNSCNNSNSNLSLEEKNVLKCLTDEDILKAPEKINKEIIKNIYNKIYDTGDFLINMDMNSLYPTAMSKYEYPIGLGTYSLNPKEDFENGLLGIYHIEFDPPKHLIMAILPERNKPWISNTENKQENKQWKSSGIKWSLEPYEGIYTNIDIQQAIDHGYKIIFKSNALVWKNKDFIFKNYIQKIYEIKKLQDQYKKENNPEYNEIKRMIAKDMMNTIYGKCCQKPIKDKHSVIKTEKEFYEFIQEYELTDWQILKQTQDQPQEIGVFLKGEPTTVDNNKPQHIAAFILSYSRKIMLEQFSLVTNKFKDCNFSYTDTDSIHMKGSVYKELKLNYPQFYGEEMGQLKNDISIDKEAIIFKEICLAPKNYIYYYITEQGNFGICKKIKGIPYKVLNEITLNDFENETEKTLKYLSMKRHFLKCKNEKYLKIENLNCTRTFLKNKYNKLTLNESSNEFRPFGYEESTDEQIDVKIEPEQEKEMEYDDSSFKSLVFYNEIGISGGKWYFRQEPALHLKLNRLVKLVKPNPMQYIQNNSIHLFSKLNINSIIEYLKANKNNGGYLNEIIQGKCKLYCDVDLEKNNENNSILEIEILNKILECICEAALQYNVTLFVNDFKILTSTTQKKFSFHIVNPQHIFQQQQYQKDFWNCVIEISKQDKFKILWNITKNQSCFDDCVYNNYRAFRCIYCKKPGSESILKPVDYNMEELLFEDINIIDYLIMEENNYNGEYSKLSKFENPGKKTSLVKQKQNKNDVHIIHPNQPFNLQIQDLLNKNKNNLQGYNLTHGIFDGTIIKLDRIQSGFCKCCERIHEKENGYINIKSNYLRCYRNLKLKYDLL